MSTRIGEQDMVTEAYDILQEKDQETQIKRIKYIRQDIFSLLKNPALTDPIVKAQVLTTRVLLEEALAGLDKKGRGFQRDAKRLLQENFARSSIDNGGTRNLIKQVLDTIGKAKNQEDLTQRDMIGDAVSRQLYAFGITSLAQLDKLVNSVDTQDLLKEGYKQVGLSTSALSNWLNHGKKYMQSEPFIKATRKAIPIDADLHPGLDVLSTREDYNDQKLLRWKGAIFTELKEGLSIIEQDIFLKYQETFTDKEFTAWITSSCEKIKFMSKTKYLFNDPSFIDLKKQWQEEIKKVALALDEKTTEGIVLDDGGIDIVLSPDTDTLTISINAEKSIDHKDTAIKTIPTFVAGNKGSIGLMKGSTVYKNIPFAPDSHILSVGSLLLDDIDEFVVGLPQLHLQPSVETTLLGGEGKKTIDLKPVIWKDSIQKKLVVKDLLRSSPPRDLEEHDIVGLEKKIDVLPRAISVKGPVGSYMVAIDSTGAEIAKVQIPAGGIAKMKLPGTLPKGKQQIEFYTQYGDDISAPISRSKNRILKDLEIGEDEPPTIESPTGMSFPDRTGVAVSTDITSNEVIVRGLTGPVPITIAEGEYSINGGAWTNTAGTIDQNDRLRVRVSSSASHSTPITATIVAGGTTETFTVTTEALTTSRPLILRQPNSYELSGVTTNIAGTFQPNQTGGTIEIISDSDAGGVMRAVMGLPPRGDRVGNFVINNVSTDAQGNFTRGMSLRGLPVGENYILRTTFGGVAHDHSFMYRGPNTQNRKPGDPDPDESRTKRAIPKRVRNFFNGPWDAVASGIASYFLGRNKDKKQDAADKGKQGDLSKDPKGKESLLSDANFGISAPAEGATLPTNATSFTGNLNPGSTVSVSYPGGRKQQAFVTGTTWKFDVAGLKPGKKTFVFTEKRVDGKTAKRKRTVIVPVGAEDKKTPLQDKEKKTKDKDIPNKQEDKKNKEKKTSTATNIWHGATNLSDVPVVKKTSDSVEKTIHNVGDILNMHWLDDLFK